MSKKEGKFNRHDKNDWRQSLILEKKDSAEIYAWKLQKQYPLGSLGHFKFYHETVKFCEALEFYWDSEENAAVIDGNIVEGNFAGMIFRMNC